MRPKYNKKKPIGWCYFLKSGEYYKVGITCLKKLDKRIKNYRTHNPHEVILMNSIFSENYVEIESYMHEVFFSKKRATDWEKLSDAKVVKIYKFFEKCKQYENRNN